MPFTTTRYKFYHSTVFDGNQESNLSSFTMYPRKAAASSGTHSLTKELWFGSNDEDLTPDSGGYQISTPSNGVAVQFGLYVRMRGDNAPSSGDWVASKTGTKVEVVSGKTEHGVMLGSLGNIAAILRYNPNRS